MPNVDVVVSDDPPRMGAFEVVTDDGALLYSKLDTGFPPDIAEVTEIVVQHLKWTKKPTEQVTNHQEPHVEQRKTWFKSAGLIAASSVLIVVIGVVVLRLNRSKAASSQH